jgi:predicted AlkP superfamily pyrophosphatase or phosphodiesterase
MKRIKFQLIILFLVFFSFCEAQRKAVFIILDGISADVVEKMETPVLREIAAHGGYTRAYVGGEKGGYSQSPTVSAVGYNHLLTGTWSNKHNVWDNDIKAPNYNYWNIFRIAEKANPALKTAIFSSWTDNRTRLAGEGLPEAGSLRLDYSFDGFELDEKRFPHTKDRKFMLAIDEHVSAEAGRYITTNGPDLSWVYLEFTDDMGHMYGDGPEYHDAIRKADVQVGKIWNAIQERQQKYGEQWMIVVTTDHGRDAQTGKDHGGQTDRERTTWISTNVKDLNQRFKQNPAVTDIMPSIMRFMNIEIPQATKEELDGVPFIGALSVSDLKAKREGDTIVLTWNVINPEGQAEILLSVTNNFKEGKTDNYVSLGKTEISKGKYVADISKYGSVFYKLRVKAPANEVNTWVK